MKIYFNYIYFYNVAYSLHMSEKSLVSSHQEEKVRPDAPGGLFLLINPADDKSCQIFSFIRESPRELPQRSVRIPAKKSRQPAHPKITNRTESPPAAERKSIIPPCQHPPVAALCSKNKKRRPSKQYRYKEFRSKWPAGG